MSQPGTSYGAGGTGGTGALPTHPEPVPKVPIYRDWMVIQLLALVFLTDQFTKYLVRQLLQFRTSFPDDGFLRFTHTHNTGSAFGIFQGQNTPLILVSFIGIAILIMIYRSQPQPTNLLRLSIGLQLGGAVGNLLDRLRLGHVTDFIDVGPWPVFNLADASIVTGLILLAWLFLRPGAQRRVTVVETGPNLAAREVQQREDSWCPICDGDLVWESVGWHCSTCGARERIEDNYLVEENYWATAPDRAAGLPGVASTLATGGDGLWPIPGASSHAAGEGLPGNEPGNALAEEGSGPAPSPIGDVPMDPVPETSQESIASPDRPAGEDTLGPDRP